MFYYDVTQTLSYNCLFNFIIGNRGAGKTFSCKDYGISHYIKKKKQFIYLRRYKEELQKTIPTFFADIKVNYPNKKFEVKGNKFYLDDEIIGYYFSLSTANILKSMSFPDVDTIIFDEFIIDKGCYHYLSDEVKSFLEFYETVSRMRDVKVLFLANAITMTNPYFLYFNIDLPYNKTVKTFKDNLLLIQLVQNQDFIEAKKKTKFGRLIADTDYEKYSIENQFLRDNKNFIEHKAPNSKFYFTFKHNDVFYGVWYNNDVGKLFVSLDYDKSNPIIYSTTLEDHTPNTMLLKNPNKSIFWRNFITQYKLGNIRFENIKIKNIVTDLIRTILC